MSRRIHSIDTLRAIAIFFVLIAHVRPFEEFGTYGNHIFFLLDTIGQFDVQFFFVVSGYFLAKKLQHGNINQHIRPTIQKLSSMYLFGLLIHLPVLVLWVIGGALFNGQNPLTQLIVRLLDGLSPLDLLYYGDSIAGPLWFLTALIFSILFISLFVRLEKTRYLLPIAVITHIIGIIGENYSMIVDIPFPTRDAIFFGFFYVTLGFHLWSIDWTPDRDRSQLYLGAFGVLLLFQLVEQYAISYFLRASTISQGIYETNYTITTIFLVLALFTYVLSNPDLGKTTLLPNIGKYAVGVYLVHLPVYRTIMAVNRVLEIIANIDLTTSVFWHLFMTPLVYALSLGIYLLAAKIGIIELDGSHIPRLSRIRGKILSIRSRTDSIPN